MIGNALEGSDNTGIMLGKTASIKAEIMIYRGGSGREAKTSVSIGI